MANNTGKKFGGRQIGTPNKLTRELKEVLKDLIEKEMDLAPEHLEQLEVKDRLEILVKLLPYILPKGINCDIQAQGFNYEITLNVD